MAFNNSFTAVVGATYTAAQYNTHVRDNFTAVWVYTTAGDIVYATSATALARLGKPSVDSVLKNTSAGVPSWLAITDLAKGLHAKNIGTFNAADQNITNTSYTDITNATLDIVITKTCTILMMATGVFAVTTNGHRTLVQAVIGGTGSGDSGAPHTSVAGYLPFAIEYYRTGIGPGTITCKLQGRANAGGNTGVYERGRIVLQAFEE